MPEDEDTLKARVFGILLANLYCNAFNRVMSKRLIASLFISIVFICGYIAFAYKSPNLKALENVQHVIAQRLEKSPPTPLHLSYTTVKSSTQLTPSTPFKGKIKEIFVHEGQMIEKDDPLFMMDHQNINAAMLDLEKQLKKEKAKHRELQIKQHRTEELIQLETKNVERLTDALKRAKNINNATDAKRYQKALNIAQSKRQQHIDHLRASSSVVFFQKKHIDDLLVKKIQIHEKTTINLVKAPIAGTAKNVRLNTYITYPKDTPICQIIPKHDLTLQFKIPEHLKKEINEFPNYFFIVFNRHQLPLNAFDHYHNKNEETLALHLNHGDFPDINLSDDVTIQIFKYQEKILYRIPKTAMHDNDTIYKIVDNALEPITVHYEADDPSDALSAFVSSEYLTDGDVVVVSKMDHPQRNQHVQIN